MISALAKTSQVLNEPKYLTAAEFIQSKIYDSKNKLLFRRLRDGEKKVPGNSSDYSFLIQGLIDLYEASFNIKWLEWAIELTAKSIQLFHDKQNGGFYTTSADANKNLFLRMKDDYVLIIPVRYPQMTFG